MTFLNVRVLCYQSLFSDFSWKISAYLTKFGVFSQIAKKYMYSSARADVFFVAFCQQVITKTRINTHALILSPQHDKHVQSRWHHVRVSLFDKCKKTRLTFVSGSRATSARRSAARDSEGRGSPET